MMLILFALFSILALLLTILLNSRKIMNFVSLLHSASYFALACYVLAFRWLPIYFTEKYYFFMNNFALYEVLISSFIFFVSTLYLEGYIISLIETKELDPKHIRFFYICTNLLLVSLTFAFFSNNLALFWIFLELTTLFSAVLIVILNAKKNIYAAFNYVFIASTCMLFSFVGLILLFASTQHVLGAGTLNWSGLIQNADAIPAKLAIASFVFIFIGFAAKSGIAPFHTWLPHAHSRAPSAISAILSGVLLNAGMYGIIRVFAVFNQTPAKNTLSWFLIIAGIITLLIASLSMLQQSNIKKLIAFSSIEHMGIMLIAVGIATKASLFWSLFYIAGHSLSKSLLFLCAGIINRQYESNKIASVKDLIKLQPFASIGIIIGSLAIIGAPPFIMFLPKFFVLLELSRKSLIALFIAMALILIAASAFILFMTQLFSSSSEEKSAASKLKQYNVPFKMKLAIMMLIICVILLGIYFPKTLGDIISNILIELRIGA